MKNVTSDKRNLWMFPFGTVGRDMIYNLFTNFIFTYILFTRNLTAAQLGAVTAIMVGARVFDALNIPLWATSSSAPARATANSSRGL